MGARHHARHLLNQRLAAFRVDIPMAGTN